jgi:hypothetical protein
MGTRLKYNRLPVPVRDDSSTCSSVRKKTHKIATCTKGQGCDIGQLSRGICNLTTPLSAI